jgi:hypothetical protein
MISGNIEEAEQVASGNPHQPLVRVSLRASLYRFWCAYFFRGYGEGARARRSAQKLNLMKAILVATLITTTSAAYCATILDQANAYVATDHHNASAVGLIAGREIEQAQTVTTGISGYLSQVDVWVGRQADASNHFTLTIYGIGNTPNDSSPLASFNVSANLIGSTDLFTYSMVSINTRSANLFFSIGDTFSIALSAPDEPISEVAPVWTPYSWANANPGSYLGGSRYSREIQDGPTWNQTSFTDHALNTWVDPIPEPSSAILVVTFAGLLCLKRTR